MNELDVLVIGGYVPGEKALGDDEEVRAQCRLHYRGRQVTFEFIKRFVESGGDLDATEKRLSEKSTLPMVGRSLNTIYLVDFLRRHGLRVDAVSYFLLEQARFRELMASRPRVVAISSTFISDPREIAEIARAAREISPDSIIVVGGVKVLKSYRIFELFRQGYFEGLDADSLAEDNFFLNPDFDREADVFVVEQCGELTLLDLTRRVLSGRDYRACPNLAYRNGNGLVFTERVKEPFTVGDNPVDWSKVSEDIVGFEIPVRAGMGCPYRCQFCDFVGLHDLQSRPLADLIDELRQIKGHFPGRMVWFTDDNLFASRKRALALTKAMVAAGLSLPWKGFFRVDAVTEENVGFIAESGCRQVLLGVESGSDEILAGMKKGSKAERTLKCVRLLNDHGISTLSTLIVGFPGETEETIADTIRLLNSYPSKPGAWNKYCPFPFYPLPLSPVMSPESRAKHGLSVRGNSWQHRTMDLHGAREQMMRLVREVEGASMMYVEHTSDMPVETAKALSDARDDLVRRGVTVLDQSNAAEIYEIFASIVKKRERPVVGRFDTPASASDVRKDPPLPPGTRPAGLLRTDQGFRRQTDPLPTVHQSTEDNHAG